MTKGDERHEIDVKRADELEYIIIGLDYLHYTIRFCFYIIFLCFTNYSWQNYNTIDKIIALTPLFNMFIFDFKFIRFEKESLYLFEYDGDDDALIGDICISLLRSFVGRGIISIFILASILIVNNLILIQIPQLLMQFILALMTILGAVFYVYIKHIKKDYYKKHSELVLEQKEMYPLYYNADFNSNYYKKLSVEMGMKINTKLRWN